jgi:hypothetical protein
MGHPGFQPTGFCIGIGWNKPASHQEVPADQGNGKR